MLDFLPVGLPYFMEHSLIALSSSKDDDKVKLLFAEYNFDDAVFDEGLNMHASITKLDAEQKSIHEKQYKVGRKFRKLMKITKDTFSKYDTLTDLAFEGLPHELIKLCTEVKRQTKQFAWLASAKKFYTKAIEEIQNTEDDDVLTRYTKYGVTKEKLEAALGTVTDAEKAKTKHVNLKGEAEEKIRERDAEVEIFYKWMKRFVDVAELAFENKPQYMEKLSINILSDGYKRKDKDKEDNGEDEQPAEPAEPETQPVETTAQKEKS